MKFKVLMKRLYFLKPVLNLTFLLCILSLAYLFIFSTIALQNKYALTSLLLAGWSLLFSAFLGLGVNAPDNNRKASNWLSTIRYKLTDSLFSLAIVAFILLTFALIYVTIKLFTV